MKRHLLGAGLVLLAALPVRAASDSFTAALTPAEIEAAGLASLTPAQRAQLDAFVEKYRSGALVEARRNAADAERAKRAAEAQAARAEAAAVAARAEATRAQAAAKSAAAESTAAKVSSWFKKTPKEEPVAVESTIPGRFQGWEPRQVFLLANGQRWQVANAESYYTPAIDNPRVIVTPASLTGFWLRFPDLGVEVRVKPLSE